MKVAALAILVLMASAMSFGSESSSDLKKQLTIASDNIRIWGHHRRTVIAKLSAIKTPTVTPVH